MEKNLLSHGKIIFYELKRLERLILHVRMRHDAIVLPRHHYCMYVCMYIKTLYVRKKYDRWEENSLDKVNPVVSYSKRVDWKKLPSTHCEKFCKFGDVSEFEVNFTCTHESCQKFRETRIKELNIVLLIPNMYFWGFSLQMHWLTILLEVQIVGLSENFIVI